VRTKVTLVLVFLNVALFFFIFKFERAWRTEAQLLEARRRVLGPEAADIRTLEVAGAFRLERRADGWWLTSPLEWPANPHAVASIINDLKLLEHVTSFPTKDLGRNNNPTLADYGLDKPRLTVAFTSGDDPRRIELRLGTATKVDDNLYLLSPDGATIHVVRRALAESLALPLAQLRADALFTVPVFEARSLTLRAGAGGAPVRVRKEEASGRWSFDTPIIARASKLALDVTIGELNGLHAATFNPATPPAALPSAAPTLSITLEGRDRRETLYLGEPLGPTALPAGAATAPDVEYYAQLKDRVALFTVALPAKLLERLRNAQESLREKQFFEFDRTAVTAVTLAAPNPPPLTLQRLEAAANTTEPAWQIVRRGDAATAGPQTLPADRAAVKRLLDQLAALAAKKFQSDAPAAADLENWGFNRPERTVALTLAGNPAPLELQLGTDAAGNVYARVGPGGSSIYAVEAAILRELPVQPRAWRDRLVRELPAAARITALKLTDLASNQLVLDLAFDADGKLQTPVADPKPVETLVAQLRTLRAKSFVQDGFTERVTLAGEERPWRFQLDATVSLPGGAGAAQTNVSTLYFSDRGGGAQQLAGAKDAEAVFEIEQPLLDALWALTYRDPGPPAR
jgi:hypothetical protein